MTTRVLCKVCKSIIEPGEMNDPVVYCDCGQLVAQKTAKGIRAKAGGGRETYAMVDEKGDELVITDMAPKEVELLPAGPKMGDDEVFSELMLSIKHQIEAMESLSQGGRFSPATNQDLLAHLIWEQGVFQVLYRMLKRTP